MPARTMHTHDIQLLASAIQCRLCHNTAKSVSFYMGLTHMGLTQLGDQAGSEDVMSHCNAQSPIDCAAGTHLWWQVCKRIAIRFWLLLGPLHALRPAH
jgi:hypothetical protein